MVNYNYITKYLGGFMKKILLILIITTLNVFSTSKIEGLEMKINSNFSFFMTQEQLEKSIRKKPVLVSNGVTYYENLPDPIGINRELVSFVFTEEGIISSVYSSETTPSEHTKIYKQYLEYFSNVPESKLTKLENPENGSLLYFNRKNNILLQVAYISNQTVITEQLFTEELLNYRINLVLPRN